MVKIGKEGKKVKDDDHVFACYTNHVWPFTLTLVTLGRVTWVDFISNGWGGPPMMSR